MKESAYKKAGVDIDAGAALVDRIKAPVSRTRRNGVMSGLGGFGALFDLKETGYADPLLVSATDGVGTKLRVAIEAGRHNTVGIDLVAMCVNDILTMGAEPLFFLDYFATGALNLDQAEQVITGIADGCIQAGCSLIGGETAEMPGMYNKGDYDLAGFSVGVVERARVLTGESIEAGDVILGLASSGPHSNGYSLIRKIIADNGLSYNSSAPFDIGNTIGQALLSPTRIYVKPLLNILQQEDNGIKALAHITGGGLAENITRVIPQDFSVRLDAATWPLPPVFKWLAEMGNLSTDDLARTFNCGLGMVIVCSKSEAEKVARQLADEEEAVFVIGAVEEKNKEAILIENREKAWLHP